MEEKILFYNTFLLLRRMRWPSVLVAVEWLVNDEGRQLLGKKTQFCFNQS